MYPAGVHLPGKWSLVVSRVGVVDEFLLTGWWGIAAAALQGRREEQVLARVGPAALRVWVRGHGVYDESYGHQLGALGWAEAAGVLRSYLRGL